MVLPPFALNDRIPLYATISLKETPRRVDRDRRDTNAAALSRCLGTMSYKPKTSLQVGEGEPLLPTSPSLIRYRLCCWHCCLFPSHSIWDALSHLFSCIGTACGW